MSEKAQRKDATGNGEKKKMAEFSWKKKSQSHIWSKRVIYGFSLTDLRFPLSLSSCGELFFLLFIIFFDSSSLNKSESKKKLWVRRLDTTLEIDSSFVILCTNMSKLVLCVANLFEMMCSKFQLSSSNRSKVMPNYVGKFITKKGDKFLLIFSSNWPQAKFSKSR